MKYLYWIIAISLVVLSVIRFTGLENDFPAKYTDGGFIFTDEGWYCSGAINKIETGTWLMDSTFNSILTMPINHLIMYPVFLMFGKSIITARVMQILFFYGFVFVVFLILNYFSGQKSAFLSIIPLLCSEFLFFYSRIALLEFEMLFFVSLSILMVLNSKYLFSALFLCIAILTKTSAIFAVLPVLYLAGSRNYKQLWKYGILLIIPLYFIIIKTYFPIDYNYFFNANFTGRRGFSLLDTIFKAGLFSSVVYAIGVVGFISVFKRYKYQKFEILLFVFCLAMLSMNSYHPMRYFIIFSLPITFFYWEKVWSTKNKKPVIILSLFLILMNSISIYQTMKNKSDNLSSIFSDVSKNVKGNGLYSSMGHTVNLYTGLKYCNSLKRFYLIRNTEAAEIRDLKRKYRIIHEYKHHRTGIYLLEMM